MAKTGRRKPEENLNEITYYVKGMHCASCELLIEKRLLKHKGIEAAEASAKNGQVTIFYEGKKPAVSKLNREFKENGYTFFQEPVSEKKESPLLSFDQKGQLLINTTKASKFVQVVGISLLLIIGFLLWSRSGIAARIAVSSSSTPLAFLLFGLIAGTSSCAALVGGIVLSMSKQWSEVYSREQPTWQRFQPHLLFNVGRLASFALLGALLGTLGALLQISLTATALLAIGVSIMMILLALQMLGIRHFQRFQLTMPKFISRFVADEANFQGRYMPFAIGALTFFLPCGFTITAQGLALASGSAFRGANILFSFALGTLPMLAAIGYSSLKFTTREHLSAKFLKIAGALVLFFGFYNFNSQLNVLGLPSLDDIRLGSSETIQAAEDGLAPIIDGKQVLKMDALAYGYEPNEFKVRVGTPVRWEIADKGVSGCTNAIVSKGLFDGQIRLNKDLNVKEFTPQKAGRYKFSCWMGMISGTITVIDQDGSSGELVNPSDEEIPSVEIPSGARGCGGGSGCSGSCGGGCGNPSCSYVE